MPARVLVVDDEAEVAAVARRRWPTAAMPNRGHMVRSRGERK